MLKNWHFHITLLALKVLVVPAVEFVKSTEWQPYFEMEVS
jgi:hypothetical protein